MVQTENGNLLMMVQGTEPVFEVGRSVLVLYGSPLRVIADRTQGGSLGARVV